MLIVVPEKISTYMHSVVVLLSPPPPPSLDVGVIPVPSQGHVIFLGDNRLTGDNDTEDESADDNSALINQEVSFTYYRGSKNKNLKNTYCALFCISG